jgi:hypothetical protein
MQPRSDSRFQNALLLSSALVVALAIAAPAFAVPVSVTHNNLGNCDILIVPTNLHELGLGAVSGGPFPSNEEITASDVLTGNDACSSSINTLVTMTNLSGKDWEHVWYVADPETVISNFDGLVNGELAFKIDFVGANSPLVFESLIADGIFQAGETWEFLIDDYLNALGLPASAFGSCAGGSPCTTGLVGSLSVGDLDSSGSIIVTPEPTTVLLLAFGLAGLAVHRRRVA